MRKIAAGFAVAALLLVAAGCPSPQKVTDLESQVEALTEQVEQLKGEVEILTEERDELKERVAELEKSPTPARTPAPARTPSPARQPLPPTKK